MKRKLLFMEAIKKSRIAHVRHPETLDLLTNIHEHKFLLPYMQSEHSIAEVAKLLRLDFQLVYRKTKRLERCGLIKPTRTQTRAGRPIQLYASVAKQFFASASVLPLEQIFDQIERDLTPKIRRGLMDTYYNALDGEVGTHFFVTEDNHLSVRIGHANPSQPLRPRTPAISLWQDLYLNHQTAKQLQKELEQLIERYRQPIGKDTYILHIELAPLLEQPL
jgi:predicted transcriptional regulator